MIRTPTRCISTREPGDHIGWHYDTSYYARPALHAAAGSRRRFLVPTGLRTAHARAGRGRGLRARCRSRRAAWCFSMATNCATASRRFGAGEMRVSLTFEYVTDPRMHPWLAFHLQHEGRRRVLRLSAGVSPPRAKARRTRMRRAARLAAVGGRAAVHRRAGLAGLAGGARDACAGRLGAAVGGAVSPAAAGARRRGDSGAVRAVRRRTAAARRVARALGRASPPTA